MKRHLVVTSSTTIATSRPDTDIPLAATAERRRLEAYLYGHSTLEAFASDNGPIATHDDGKRTYRITCRALVIVEVDDYTASERLRYLADYQADRLRSGSFGVEDYVEDERQARLFVLGDDAFDEEPEPSLAEALAYAAEALAREEVLGSLGLDSDYVDGGVTVTVDGVERDYTEADLEKDTARHNKIVELLRAAAATASYSVADKHGNRVAQEGCDRCACGCKYWENDRCVDCGSTPVVQA